MVSPVLLVGQGQLKACPPLGSDSDGTSYQRVLSCITTTAPSQFTPGNQLRNKFVDKTVTIPPSESPTGDLTIKTLLIHVSLAYVLAEGPTDCTIAQTTDGLGITRCKVIADGSDLYDDVLPSSALFVFANPAYISPTQYVNVGALPDTSTNLTGYARNLTWALPLPTPDSSGRRLLRLS